MNVKTETKTRYSITDLTEQQAQDLLQLAANAEGYVALDIQDESIDETLNALRQSLMQSGLTVIR